MLHADRVPLIINPGMAQREKLEEEHVIILGNKLWYMQKKKKEVMFLPGNMKKMFFEKVQRDTLSHLRKLHDVEYLKGGLRYRSTVIDFFFFLFLWY